MLPFLCRSSPVDDDGLGSFLPKWIPDNEKGNIDFVCVFQNVVAGGLDHFAVGDDDGTAIKCFLLPKGI